MIAGAEESALGDADVCGDGDGREIEDEHLLAEPNVVTPFKPPRQPDVQRERMTAPCPIRTPNRRSNVTHNAEGQGQGERKKTARTSTQSASLKREAPRSKLELLKRFRSMGLWESERWKGYRCERDKWQVTGVKVGRGYERKWFAKAAIRRDKTSADRRNCPA